jgi:hypothetical protein
MKSIAATETPERATESWRSVQVRQACGATIRHDAAEPVQPNASTQSMQTCRRRGRDRISPTRGR